MSKPVAVWFGSGVVAVLCSVLLSCGGGGEGAGEALPPPKPVVPATGVYGPAIQADDLANTQLGGTYNTQTSYRFLCDHEGALQGLRFYLVGKQVGEPDYRPGYSAGTGGTVRVELCPDDGTSLHAPDTSRILATATLTNPLDARYFPTLAFDAPAGLQKGVLYHLVFRNTDADPLNNFISVNSLYLEKATVPLQGLHGDRDWGQMLWLKVAGGAFRWVPRDSGNAGRGYTPILQLNYQDGYRAGVGYTEIWSSPRAGTTKGGPKAISGSAGVRVTFTVSAARRRVTGVHLRLARTSGSDPLTVRLEASSGAVLAEGRILAGAVGSAHAFANCQLSAECRLDIGSTYRLRLSAPAGTEYRVFPVAKGSHSTVAFAPATYWQDGFAEWTANGSTWQKWDQWWDGPVYDPNNMGVLQFWFDADAE